MLVLLHVPLHVLLHVPLHVLLHVPLHELLHCTACVAACAACAAACTAACAAAAREIHSLPTTLVATAGSGKGPTCPFLHQLMAVECVCMHAVAMVMINLLAITIYISCLIKYPVIIKLILLQVHLLLPGKSPFNEVCSPLIRWLAVAGGLPICKLLVQ